MDGPLAEEFSILKHEKRSIYVHMTYSRYSGSRSGTPDIQTTTTTSSNSAPDPSSSSSPSAAAGAAQRSQQKIHFRREFANLRSRIN